MKIKSCQESSGPSQKAEGHVEPTNTRSEHPAVAALLAMDQDGVLHQRTSLLGLERFSPPEKTKKK